MNIQHLRYFQVMAHHENISKAARQLLVSQPALSNVLQQLEEELGVPLFDRDGKRIVLNGAGRAFLQTTTQVLHTLDGGIDHLRESAYTTGMLRICLHGVCPELYDAVAAFSKEYPDVQFKFSKSDKLTENFSLSPFDFALLTDFECEDYPNVRIAQRKAMYAVLAKDHPLAARDSLKLSDLKNEHFCFVSASEDRLEHAYERCVEGGFVPKVRYITDASDFSTSLLTTGTCVAVTYNTNLEKYNTEALTLIELSDTPVGRTNIHLCLLQDEPSPLANLFFQFVRDNYWQDEL